MTKNIYCSPCGACTLRDTCILSVDCNEWKMYKKKMQFIKEKSRIDQIAKNVVKKHE